MADAAPWLTIIGLGEDGPDGLSLASRQALDRAEVVTGTARHLGLLPGLGSRAVLWPVPFADGIAPLMAWRGRSVVMLASGDPFWFGAGAVLAERLEPGEWLCHPGPSCFALAAARLGWRLETVACLGLHAAPLSRLRPQLAQGQRVLVTLRDAAAVAEVLRVLQGLGFGDSRVWLLEALGGPRERVRLLAPGAAAPDDVQAPVAMAIVAVGSGLPCSSGLPDGLFENDGQITKRPMRALTLSALAPRPGEMLWDIGAGSGSIGIEWLLAHPANRAVAIEADASRAARLVRNANALGMDRLVLRQGRAPDVLAGLPLPDAVFIGGGVDQTLLEALWLIVPQGTRIVVNGVTLEAESLFARWQAEVGGSLLRIELAEASALGSKRGWRAAMPVVQWSVVR